MNFIDTLPTLQNQHTYFILLSTWHLAIYHWDLCHKQFQIFRNLFTFFVILWRQDKTIHSCQFISSWFKNSSVLVMILKQFHLPNKKKTFLKILPACLHLISIPPHLRRRLWTKAKINWRKQWRWPYSNTHAMQAKHLIHYYSLFITH